MIGFTASCIIITFLYVTFNRSICFANLLDINHSHHEKLAPCKACTVFVESIDKAIKATEKSNFAGGNTAWEQEKLNKWASSEIRLVEIQDLICKDEKYGKNDCYSMHEQHEALLEEWWLNRRHLEPDLFKHVCIDELAVCCPKLHYGEKCVPCPGYPDNVCNNNGRCRGAGTRKGNGKCNCDVGYASDECDTCAEGYFESYRDTDKFLCTKCHRACKNGCDSAGPSGCKECADGWFSSKEGSCIDINECTAGATPLCSREQFCVNTEGSYKCVNCDKACSGCTGEGPDMCIHCAKDYLLVDNVCSDAKEETRRYHVLVSRYLMYFGLCVATFIVFQKNPWLAAIIGTAVGVYITISEYVFQLNNNVL